MTSMFEIKFLRQLMETKKTTKLADTLVFWKVRDIC